MLIQNARVKLHARCILQKSWPCCCQTRQSTTSRWTPKDPTRSILLQEGNPITNPELYKLHKAPNDEASQSDQMRAWEADPYLRMLASPLRRCTWSGRVMPRDLLIPLKAATYSNSSDGPEKQQTTVFARGVLHPSSLPKQDSFGRKNQRGYIVCKRSAVLDYVSRDSQWKLMDKSAVSNPLLPFQIESQLRRRISQELEILQRNPHSQSYFTRVSSSDYHDMIKMGHIKTGRMSIDKEPVAAIVVSEQLQLPFRDQSNALVTRDPSSVLLPIIKSEADVRHRHRDLPVARIPLYSLKGIFAWPEEAGEIKTGDAEIESGRTQAEGELQDESNQTMPERASGDQQSIPSSDRKRAKKAAPAITHPKDLTELKEYRPDIYEREKMQCKDLHRQLSFTLTDIVAGTKQADVNDDEKLDTPTVVLVNRGCKATVPLLLALWRWRMWVGEGWNDLGFGLAEATGRAQSRQYT